MKVSIITVVFNNREFIESAIKSVLSQTYKDIEYIIVDAGSIDGTVEIIKKYGGKISKFISEKDKGIYDAMNKGINLATGELVAILNSDDVYENENVISNVVEMIKSKNADCLWGDLVYVSQKNPEKIIRYWKSSEYENGKFKIGWHPPHPTFFVKKTIYDKCEIFNLDFKIAADYELMLRFLGKCKITGIYLPKVLVRMRTGGESNKSFKNILKANIEVYRAWKINGLKTNFFIIFKKPLSKIKQLFVH